MRATGFTLLELLAATAITAMLLSLAVPSFQSLSQNNRLSGQVNDFLASLLLARNEAIERSVQITVCKTATNVDINQINCDNGAHWHHGWIVFEDINHNSQREPQETLIQVYPAFSNNTLIHGNAFVRNRIRFNAQGYSTGSNGRLIFCDQRGDDKARVVIISSVGRVRTSSFADQPGDNRLHFSL